MINPLDTHSYDGKLNVCQIPSISLTLEEKKERGNQLIEAAKHINPVAQHFLRIIVNSMGTAANVDGTNGLVADDLICICWIYRESYEFMMELEMQLMDMATGFCPQGRTHRLYQILMAYL